MCDDITAGTRLHYIDAHHVQGGGACLDRLDVREEAGYRREGSDVHKVRGLSNPGVM